VRERSAEDGDGGVADELLDEPAEVFDLRTKVSKNSWRRSRTSSGSLASAWAVESTMSTKSTETSLRSSAIGRA